jgi:hypothetical protein
MSRFRSEVPHDEENMRLEEEQLGVKWIVSERVRAQTAVATATASAN